LVSIFKFDFYRDDEEVLAAQRDLNKDLKNSVYKDGSEIKLQRNVLDQYQIEEVRLKSELLKKRFEFERRINVCKDKQLDLAVRQEKV
jgi:hypothetical protein